MVIKFIDHDMRCLPQDVCDILVLFLQACQVQLLLLALIQRFCHSPNKIAMSHIVAAVDTHEQFHNPISFMSVGHFLKQESLEKFTT